VTSCVPLIWAQNYNCVVDVKQVVKSGLCSSGLLHQTLIQTSPQSMFSPSSEPRVSDGENAFCFWFVETAYFSKTLVSTYHSTWHQSPQQHRRPIHYENPKSRIQGSYRISVFPPVVEILYSPHPLVLFPNACNSIVGLDKKRGLFLFSERGARLESTSIQFP
jgi:hypothetical protein